MVFGIIGGIVAALLFVFVQQSVQKLISPIQEEVGARPLEKYAFPYLRKQTFEPSKIFIQTPEETKKNGDICPVCKRELTIGVMHRVDELADNEESNFIKEADAYGTVWLKDKKGIRPPYINLVPLLEILSEALNSGVSSQAVQNAYDNLISQFGSEHEILLRSPLEKIQTLSGVTIAEGIQKVRERNIHINPGYDNTYGVVEIWGNSTKYQQEIKSKEEQKGLF
jgi:PHP family Zn ribbon phosphoesterase